MRAANARERVAQAAELVEVDRKLGGIIGRYRERRLESCTAGTINGPGSAQTPDKRDALHTSRIQPTSSRSVRRRWRRIEVW